MTTKSKSRPSRSISPTEISSLVCAYGITRDQARRLVNRIGKNRAKLSEAARILNARLPSRSASEAKHPWKSNNLRARADERFTGGSIVQRYTTAAPRLTQNFSQKDVNQKKAPPLPRPGLRSLLEILSNQNSGDGAFMKM